MQKQNKWIALLLLVVMVVLAVACTAESTPDEPATAPPANGDEPVSSDDETAVPAPDPTGEVITGTPIIDEIEILLMESFPLQASVVVKGNFRNGCSELGEITQAMADHTITLEITTSQPAGAMCTEALVPFEESVPLDILGLEAGEYTVVVNGVTETFTLDVDNVAPEGF